MSRQRLAYQATQFERIFGERLAKFWLGEHGRLDVTRFDEEIVRSGGNFMADVVEERYGHEAVELITQLL